MTGTTKPLGIREDVTYTGAMDFNISGDKIITPGINWESTLTPISDTSARFQVWKRSSGTHWTGMGRPYAYHNPEYWIVEIVAPRESYGKIYGQFRQRRVFASGHNWRTVRAYALAVCERMNKEAEG